MREGVKMDKNKPPEKASVEVSGMISCQAAGCVLAYVLGACHEVTGFSEAVR
jgi:hypothetical protein